MATGKQIKYYHSFQEDFVESAAQDCKLPADYVWIRKGRADRFASAILYAVAFVFGKIYGKLVLHLKIVKNADLKDFSDTGAIIYANHTQPIGDVVIPAFVCAPKRCYTVVGPANLGIPVIGTLLPWLGALPIPDNLPQTKEFLAAVRLRLQEKQCVTVYPEGHVWPYCTQIRPYPATSFSYAVQNKVPAFCMTTTYQARRHSHKPKTTVYLDGPFYPDQSLSVPAQKKKLWEQVSTCMKGRSQYNTYQYIEYRPAQEGHPEASGDMQDTAGTPDNTVKNSCDMVP